MCADLFATFSPRRSVPKAHDLELYIFTPDIGQIIRENSYFLQKKTLNLTIFLLNQAVFSYENSVAQAKLAFQTSVD